MIRKSFWERKKKEKKENLPNFIPQTKTKNFQKIDKLKFSQAIWGNN